MNTQSNTMRGWIFIRRVVTYVIGFCLPIVVWSQSGAGTPFFLPVTFVVDEDKVISSMFLEVEAVEYEMPLDLFQARANEGRFKNAFLSFANAVKSGDAAAVAQLSPTFGTPESDNFQAFAEAYARSFAEPFRTLEVMREYDFETDRLFSTEIDFKGRDWRRVFRFTAPDALSPVYWTDGVEQSGKTYLYTLIADIEQKEQEGALTISGQSPDLRFAQALPDMPGRWHFNGFAIDNWNPFQVGAAVPDHPATRLYEAAMRDFVSGDWEAYAAHYTAYSAAKILDDPDGTNVENFNDYRDSVLRLGREVIFVLNADPVYLLFHRRLSDDLIEYETVYRNPDTDEWKLTSFLVEGFMDDIAKDREFFFEPILSPLLDPVAYPPLPPQAGTGLSGPVATTLLAQGSAGEDGEESEELTPLEEDAEDTSLWWLWLLLLIAVSLVLFIVLKPKQSK